MTVMMSGGQAILHGMSAGALGDYPNFGMSMRFSVEVEGLETSSHLGLWQSCSGLELDFNCEKFAQGGANLKDQWVPGNPDYSDVMLKRPMEERSSARVKEWLQEFVTGWDSYNGVPYSKESKSPGVIITLLDYQLNPVMSWTLKNARPRKWIGPELSAGSNDVAIETLVIEHDGFLEHAGVQNSATLGTADSEGTQVKFHFNPQTIRLMHSPEIRVQSDDDGSASIVKLGALSLSIPEVRFVGPSTLANCEQLLKWTYVDQDEQIADDELWLPPLIFKWDCFSVLGHARIKVTLTEVDITYERFNEEGKPTMALVRVELKCDNRGTPGQQNPTSGGLPGRKGHTLVSGETLAGIALGTFGDPARWRAVAAANRIDDPLRVRPGSVLLLPSRTELAEGGAA